MPSGGRDSARCVGGVTPLCDDGTAPRRTDKEALLSGYTNVAGVVLSSAACFVPAYLARCNPGTRLPVLADTPTPYGLSINSHKQPPSRRATSSAWAARDRPWFSVFNKESVCFKPIPLLYVYPCHRKRSHLPPE